MKRLAAGAALITGMLLISAVVMLYWFDWNRVRTPLGDWLSGRLERTLEIRGDLRVEPGLDFGISAADVRLANPGWAGDAPMVAIEQLHISISLLHLLRGQLMLPTLRLEGPGIELRRLADGTANWALGNARDDDQPRGSIELPQVRDLRVENGKLRIADEVRRLHLAASFSAADDGQQLRWRADGRVNGGPLKLVLHADPLKTLQQDESYRITGALQAADTKLHIDGRFEQPLRLDGLTAKLAASGPNLSTLYRLFGIVLPDTPPFRLAGTLTRTGATLAARQLTGSVGDSDLSGDLAIELNGARPRLEARLRSQNLDFDDLGALVGAPPDTDETASAGQRIQARSLAEEERLLPARTLDLARIRAMDAVVRYRAEAVDAPNLPLRGVRLDLQLEKGVLTLAPLEFELPQGVFRGDIRLDASGPRAHSNLDLRLRRVAMAEVAAAAGVEEAVAGDLHGRIQLSGAGNSVRAVAATAQGRIVLAMDAGEVSHLLVEALGLDAGDALRVLVAGDERVMLRCAVLDAPVVDGVARLKPLLVDTSDSVLVGEGQIDLGEERLDLVLKAQPKDLGLAIGSPIQVGGRLRNPQIRLAGGDVAVQIIGAAALGALLTPAAAAMAFVEPGLAQNTNCTPQG